MGDYHSITCYEDPCESWVCDCPCHDDETPLIPEEPVVKRDPVDNQPSVSVPSGKVGDGAGQDCHPYPAPHSTDSTEELP